MRVSLFMCRLRELKKLKVPLNLCVFSFYFSVNLVFLMQEKLQN